MRLTFLGSVAMLVVPCALHAQTADRSAAPPNASTAAPPAHSGTYSVQNGELTVAPGLRIPNGNVPWALDTVNGKQVLVPVHHAPLKQTGTTTALDGAASHTALHTASPIFFVHTSDRTENTGDSGRGTPTGWALLQPQVDGGSRSVPKVRFSDVNAGTVCSAPVICLSAESLPEGWLRMTPQQPLESGEYVLIPVPRSATTSSSVAYDFMINMQSPAARDTVSPGQNLDVVPGKKKKR